MGRKLGDERKGGMKGRWESGKKEGKMKGRWEGREVGMGDGEVERRKRR